MVDLKILIYPAIIFNDNSKNLFAVRAIYTDVNLL